MVAFVTEWHSILMFRYIHIQWSSFFLCTRATLFLFCPQPQNFIYIYTSSIRAKRTPAESHTIPITSTFPSHCIKRMVVEGRQICTVWTNEGGKNLRPFTYVYVQKCPQCPPQDWTHTSLSLSFMPTKLHYWLKGHTQWYFFLKYTKRWSESPGLL